MGRTSSALGLRVGKDVGALGQEIVEDGSVEDSRVSEATYMGPAGFFRVLYQQIHCQLGLSEKGTHFQSKAERKAVRPPHRQQGPRRQNYSAVNKCRLL